MICGLLATGFNEGEFQTVWRHIEQSHAMLSRSQH
jgi:hypothetical protein